MSYFRTGRMAPRWLRSLRQLMTLRRQRLRRRVVPAAAWQERLPALTAQQHPAVEGSSRAILRMPMRSNAMLTVLMRSKVMLTMPTLSLAMLRMLTEVAIVKPRGHLRLAKVVWLLRTGAGTVVVVVVAAAVVVVWGAAAVVVVWGAAAGVVVAVIVPMRILRWAAAEVAAAVAAAAAARGMVAVAESVRGKCGRRLARRPSVR